MSADRFDVAIVGAGLAGLTAAFRACEDSSKVALIARGAGSFVLGLGCIAAREIDALAADPNLAEAIDFFRTACTAAGSPFDGDASQPMLLPSLLGGFESVAYAPRTLAQSELRAGSRALIVGIHGLGGFDADFLASRLNAYAQTHGLSAFYSPCQIHLPVNPGRPLTTLRIANAFDRDESFRDSLAELLHGVSAGCERVLVPSMLGLCSTSEQLARFAQSVGCIVGELPTIPPSIAGLRLYNLLVQHLRRKGVEFFEGYPAASLVQENGSCTGLRLASPGRAFTVAARTVIVASARAATELRADNSGVQNLFVAVPPNSSGEPRASAGRILAGYNVAIEAYSERGAYAAR